MAPRKAASAAGRKPPTRFGEDNLLWAAWLYYEEGLTQAEIAEHMGVSRPSVNAYLADARTRGIVSIEIAPERFRALTLARAMQDHFGLSDCYVIPSEGGKRSLIDRLGAAAAQVLARVTRSGDTLAVTWGRTTLALANNVMPAGLKKHVLLHCEVPVKILVRYSTCPILWIVFEHECGLLNRPHKQRQKQRR